MKTILTLVNMQGDAINILQEIFGYYSSNTVHELLYLCLVFQQGRILYKIAEYLIELSQRQDSPSRAACKIKFTYYSHYLTQHFKYQFQTLTHSSPPSTILTKYGLNLVKMTETAQPLQTTAPPLSKHMMNFEHSKAQINIKHISGTPRARMPQSLLEGETPRKQVKWGKMPVIQEKTQQEEENSNRGHSSKMENTADDDEVKGGKRYSHEQQESGGSGALVYESLFTPPKTPYIGASSVLNEESKDNDPAQRKKRCGRQKLILTDEERKRRAKESSKRCNEKKKLKLLAMQNQGMQQIDTLRRSVSQPQPVLQNSLTQLLPPSSSHQEAIPINSLVTELTKSNAQYLQQGTYIAAGTKETQVQQILEILKEHGYQFSPVQVPHLYDYIIALGLRSLLNTLQLGNVLRHLISGSIQQQSVYQNPEEMNDEEEKIPHELVPVKIERTTGSTAQPLVKDIRQKRTYQKKSKSNEGNHGIQIVTKPQKPQQTSQIQQEVEPQDKIQEPPKPDVKPKRDHDTASEIEEQTYTIHAELFKALKFVDTKQNPDPKMQSYTKPEKAFTKSQIVTTTQHLLKMVHALNEKTGEIDLSRSNTLKSIFPANFEKEKTILHVDDIWQDIIRNRVKKQRVKQPQSQKQAISSVDNSTSSQE